MQRNTQTLRTALFKQLDGLQNGTVKPDQAKAAAGLVMAICKTVELDLRATEMFKGTGEKMLTLALTDETEDSGADCEQESRTVENDIGSDIIERILKGRNNGLTPELIAKRLALPASVVKLVLAADAEP